RHHRSRPAAAHRRAARRTEWRGHSLHHRHRRRCGPGAGDLRGRDAEGQWRVRSASARPPRTQQRRVHAAGARRAGEQPPAGALGARAALPRGRRRMTASSETRRARLIEYMPWVFRDYLTNQGPSTALVVLLIGFMMVLPVLPGVLGTSRDGQVSRVVAASMLRELAVPLAFLGTFFATNGIISNDRKYGFFRFLFAKPVRPPQYYAMTFLVYGIGLLLVTAVMLGV